MKLEHSVVRIREFYDKADKSEWEDDKLLLLLPGETDAERLVAQVISLDIRGEFGFFINNPRTSDRVNIVGSPENIMQDISWKGNMFKVEQKKEEVKIMNNVAEDIAETVTIPLVEWREALLDWKSFYLKELGFEEFTSKQLSHVMGVLIMTRDQMSTNEDFEEEYVRYAITECAERYDLSESTLHAECKRVIGVNSISDFYEWARAILSKREHSSSNFLKIKYKNEDNLTTSFLKMLGTSI